MFKYIAECNVPNITCLVPIDCLSLIKSWEIHMETNYHGTELLN